jgi:30S ribosomal protein S31
MCLSLRARILNQPESDIMGKGDKRTLRGKIFKGSYGKTRPHHPKQKPAAKAKPAGKKS